MRDGWRTGEGGEKKGGRGKGRGRKDEWNGGQEKGGRVEVMEAGKEGPEEGWKGDSGRKAGQTGG